MKAFILKPIVWNDKNYTEPCGCKAVSGFAFDHGYGHEEWNNNPNWKWQGFRVFHTECWGKLTLQSFAQDGSLGILMISSFGGSQYALGIATSVYFNDHEDQDLIAKELKTLENGEVIWALASVQKKYLNDKENFLKHWKEQHKSIAWKCPIEHYTWFSEPILLDPTQITGKTSLTRRHGAYQVISPDKIMPYIKDHIPSDSPSLEWLQTGNFVASSNVTIKAIIANASSKTTKSSGTSTQCGYEYWIEGIRHVDPLHAKLQSKFVGHLESQNIQYEQDWHNVDVVAYPKEKPSVFCEIKPTQNISTKLAIRYAIGQLLEYRFLENKQAELQIVLGTKPKPTEVAFANSIGVKVFYLSDKGKFKEAKPKS